MHRRSYSMSEISPNNKWQWQEPGTAWKGVGLYHITLTIPTREPLLGSLVIPNNDPKKTTVEHTALGRMVVRALWDVPSKIPEIQILHYCLMPDHLHAVWYVREKMPRSIKSAVQGFWQGIKKIGRAYSYITSAPYASSTGSAFASYKNSSIVPTLSRENYHELLSQLKATTDSLSTTIGNTAYAALPPIFSEMPHIRPMGQRKQLQATLRYIDHNPQRLATKRLMPGFFRVQEGIELAGRTYYGVGNVMLLQSKHFAPVHVRNVWVKDAQQGNIQPLRDYMNACVISARRGCVMVSPFISPKEKEVMNVLLREELPFIVLSDNGFRDYYKPTDSLFDAVAAGRVLILSPWIHDPDKRRISREECVALNTMAEEISTLSSLH